MSEFSALRAVRGRFAGGRRGEGKELDLNLQQSLQFLCYGVHLRPLRLDKMLSLYRPKPKTITLKAWINVEVAMKNFLPRCLTIR